MAPSAPAEAPRWTKKKVIGAFCGLLFVAGLIAVIVVGVNSPDAYKGKAKSSSSTAESAPQKAATLAESGDVESPAPVAASPATVNNPATTTTTTTTKPATTTTPSTASPLADQATTAASKVAGLLGVNGLTDGVTNGQLKQNLPADSKLAVFLDNMGKAASVSVAETAKQTLAGAPYTACTPANGKELVKAINTDGCNYVTLTRNDTFAIPKGSILEINRPVVIVGNPAWRPVIDGSKTTRAFHVTSEGYLQLSFVEVWRGNEYTQGDFVYTRGGSILADVGAGLTIIGCIFNQPYNMIWLSNVREQLVLGGHLLIMGGEAFITGTTFLNLNPVAARFPIFIGGDELLISGMIIESASTHTQVSGMVVGAGTGVFVAIAGGVGIYTGVAFTRAIVAAFAAGYGIVISIGGGVGIFTGCTIITSIAAFTFYGAAGQQFLGGGVIVNTGVESIGSFGIAAPMGLAPFLTVGGGVSISTGATYNVNAGAQYITVTGGLSFLGGGTFNGVGVNWVRNIGLAGAWGIAGQHFNGGGNTQVTGGGNTLATGASGSWALGGQYFQGGGVLIEVAQPSAREQALSFRAGQGNHAFVCGGTYVGVGIPDDGQTGLLYAPPWQKKFWVNGKTSSTGEIGTGFPFTRNLQAPQYANTIMEMGIHSWEDYFNQGSNICLQNVTSREVSNGEPECDALLGFGQEANVTECGYYEVTQTDCDPDTPVVDMTQEELCPPAAVPCADPEKLLRVPRNQRKLRELEEGTHKTYVIRVDIIAACKDDSTCLTATQLKDVISDQLKPAGDGFSLSSVSHKVDKLLKDFMPFAAGQGSGLDECPVAEEFSVFVVTDESDEFESAKEILGSLNDDPINSEVEEYLKEEGGASGLCVFMSDVAFAKPVPSRKDSTAHFGLSNNIAGLAVGPAISVLEADASEGVVDIVAGETYTIEVRYFRPGTVINVVIENASDPKAPVQEVVVNKVMPVGAPIVIQWVAPHDYPSKILYVTAYSKANKNISASSNLLTYEDHE